MILEEELENFSDDEVSIEVPKSPTSASNVEDHGCDSRKSFTDNSKQVEDCYVTTYHEPKSYNESKSYNEPNLLGSTTNDVNNYLMPTAVKPEHSGNLVQNGTKADKSKSLAFMCIEQHTNLFENGNQHLDDTDKDKSDGTATDITHNDFPKQKEMPTDDLTCSETTSVTESVVICESESESHNTSSPISITDEIFSEGNMKQDHSISSGDIDHWSEISVADDVFMETSVPVLVMDTCVSKDNAINTKLDIPVAQSKVTDITDVSIQAMKVATGVSIASINNTSHENNFHSNFDDSLTDPNEVLPSNKGHAVTILDEGLNNFKEIGVSISRDDSKTLSRPSLNDDDCSTSKSIYITSDDPFKINSEERSVSASNIVIDTDVQSPVHCTNIKVSNNEHHNNLETAVERPQRSASQHVGNYRKIKLEGRRRQRLSIDGIHEVKSETRDKRVNNESMQTTDTEDRVGSVVNVADQVEVLNSDVNVIHSAVEDKFEVTNTHDGNCEPMNGMDTSNMAANVKILKVGESNTDYGSGPKNAHCIAKNGRTVYKNRPGSAPVLRKRTDVFKHPTKNNTYHVETVSMYSMDKIGKLSPASSNNRCPETPETCGTFTKQNKNITYDTLKDINNFHTEILALNDSSLSKEQTVDVCTGHLHPGIEQKVSTYKKSCKYTINFSRSKTEYIPQIRPNQITSDTKIARRKDGNESEMAGNEVSVSDCNQNVINTCKQASRDITMSRHRVDVSSSPVIASSIDMDNKFDTKSFLLPAVNETGNCEWKASADDVIESHTNLHFCQTEQLSLRANVKKNNEIRQSKHSIVHTHKPLTKRATYEDLYGQKAIGTSFASSQLLGFNCNKSCKSLKPEPFTSRKQGILADVEKYESRGTLNSKLEKGKILTYKRSKVVNENSNRQRHRTMNKQLAQTMALDRHDRRNMSAGIRRPIHSSLERSGSSSSNHSITATSSFTDTARLRSIRKWLKLPDDHADVTPDSKHDEGKLIIQQIIDGVLKSVWQQSKPLYNSIVNTHSCTLTDEEGDNVLGCLLQTSLDRVDPSSFTCDVIDPLDVPPVTRKHEHLISNIIKISTKYKRQSVAIPELMVNIPISHWYVEPWQEVLVRQQDNNGHWKDTGSCVDIVKIDDTEKVLYGVRHIINNLCSLAVVCRPKTTTVSLEANDVTISAVTDERVKMHTFASVVEKEISVQVIPVSKTDVEEFQAFSEQKKLVIVASSPLIIVDVKDNEPESLALDVPYVITHPKQDSGVSPKKRSSSHRQEAVVQNGMLTPMLNPSPAHSRVGLHVASPLHQSDPNQLLFHLVQLDDEDNVRIKLLENTDTSNDVIFVAALNGDSNDGNQELPDENGSVNFSLYDRYARVIAVETKGAILYSDVQNIIKPFVNFIVKHRVKVKMQQDPRNVYSILLTAFVEHPHREEKYSLLQTYKNFTSITEKEILIYEGDVVAIAFRGNVDVPDSEKLIYSFHGCRGVRRHFDIRVANPSRQRSLQTYHGALQIFTLKTPRYSALDKSLAPCAKNGWELTAEFPLLLPKYLKTTPIIVNKAPVSLKFQEPLTLDFVRALCSELSSDWSTFAKALGMGHARIQALRQHHKNPISDTVVMDVIINWMKTQAISQDKVSPVINALRLCSKWKLASELTHRFSAQRTRRSRAVRDKHLQKVFSLVGQNKTAKTKWQQILRNISSEGSSHVDDVISKIDSQYNDDYSKCLEALNYWKSTLENPSVWTVIDALRASNCRIVADTLVTLEIKRMQLEVKN